MHTCTCTCTYIMDYIHCTYMTACVASFPGLLPCAIHTYNVYIRTCRVYVKGIVYTCIIGVGACIHVVGIEPMSLCVCVCVCKQAIVHHYTCTNTHTHAHVYNNVQWIIMHIKSNYIMPRYYDPASLCNHRIPAHFEACTCICKMYKLLRLVHNMTLSAASRRVVPL